MRLSYWLVPLLIGAGAAAWYWNETHPDIVEVKVTTAETGLVEATVANTRAGTVKACRRAKMSPSMGGQISELPFREGSLVTKGEVLLKIWNQDLQAEIYHLQEAIQAARKTAEGACLQATEARRESDRSRRLRDARTISQEAYDQARTEAGVREAACKASKANVDVARASLKVAEAQLKRTILIAPFDGVIAEINGELNEYVTPSPPGILTPPVIDLIEPGCFLVTVPIDEVDAPKVKIDMPARITLDAWRGRTFDGVVSRIGSYVIDVEKQARTVDVELQFKNRADLNDLLVGYSADADIILQASDNVLRVPSETLIDENHVLRFNPETTRLERTEISKGLSNWSYTEVTSGLQQGDKIVTSVGQEGVTDGALARIKKGGADQDYD